MYQLCVVFVVWGGVTWCGVVLGGCGGVRIVVIVVIVVVSLSLSLPLSLSFIVIHRHSSSFIVIHCHSLSFIVIHRHSLSSLSLSHGNNPHSHTHSPILKHHPLPSGRVNHLVVVRDTPLPRSNAPLEVHLVLLTPALGPELLGLEGKGIWESETPTDAALRRGDALAGVAREEVDLVGGELFGPAAR